MSGACRQVICELCLSGEILETGDRAGGGGEGRGRIAETTASLSVIASGADMRTSVTWGYQISQFLV